MYSLSDFDFDLPPERIAQVPLPDRSASRLLQLDGDRITDRHFADIVDQLQAGDMLVMNNTRVLKARFFGQKDTGGQVEVLVERVLDNAHRAGAGARLQVAASRASRIRLADAFDVDVGERAGEFFTLHFDGDVFDLIEAHGRLPLPPYIEHDADEFDEQRYQTVYSKEPGAVAAPTAGLHFDQPLLDKLAAKGVQHRLRHAARGRRHLPAGARREPGRAQDAQRVVHDRRRRPSTRCAPPGPPAATWSRSAPPRCARWNRPRSRASWRPAAATPRLFITPGYQFKTVTRLITNFHLPKSTLMMLVSAFAGYDEIRTAYAHAIASEYRFFSYGDAMLLTTARNQDMN